MFLNSSWGWWGGPSRDTQNWSIQEKLGGAWSEAEEKKKSGSVQWAQEDSWCKRYWTCAVGWLLATQADKLWIEFLANIGNFRTSYQSDKNLAKVGQQVEKLQKVQSKLVLTIDQSLWMVTLGSGFGKSQWRWVSNGDKCFYFKRTMA